MRLKDWREGPGRFTWDQAGIIVGLVGFMITLGIPLLIFAARMLLAISLVFWREALGS